MIKIIKFQKGKIIMPNLTKTKEKHKHTENTEHNHENDTACSCLCAEDEEHELCSCGGHHELYDDDDDEIEIGGCSCHEHSDSDKKGIEFPLSIAILCVGLVLLVMAFIPQFDFRIRLGLSIIIYAYFGLPIISKMVSAIREGEIWNENTLMTAATIGAFCIGEFADAAAVMLLYSFGEYLQDMAFEKSKKRIQDAILKNPDYANVIRNGQEIKVNPRDVKIGEDIAVKPGEKIPLDGIVINGGAYADNSAITGESAPVSLNIGDGAISGGIVSKGVITIRVEKLYSESAVSLISKAMKEASKRKSHTEKAITRFSRIYTPIVIALAFLVVILNIFIFKNEISGSVKIGLIFLVISCPCALVLSVPLTYFAGLGAASKQGILIKGGEALDSTAIINTAVFDKTGTVTNADMEVDSIYTAANIDKHEFIAKISEILKSSNHPLCNAFTKKYKPVNKFGESKFEEIAGKGVKGEINGEKIICGNLEFLRENNIKMPDSDELPKSSPTVIHCGINGIYGGYISFTDTIKDSADNLIADLKNLGISEENIYLMSGDNKDAVSVVSSKIGIRNSNYFYGLKPHEKMEQLENLINANKKNNKVLFAGDGLNDSAVLSRADVGIAIQKNTALSGGEIIAANGTYAAIDAADVVIMDGKIEKVASIIKIAKATKRIVIQNITFALLCKILILLINTFIYSSMELAILADVGVALLCVINSLRVL